MPPRWNREDREITTGAMKSRFCGACGTAKDGQIFCDRCTGLLPPAIGRALSVWELACSAYLAAVEYFTAKPPTPVPFLRRPRRMLGGVARAYWYHNDFVATASYDCNYSVRCSTLSEAIAAAEKRRDRDAHIYVHADCEFDGLRSTMHVGLSLEEMDGKTEDQIWALLDREVDIHIAGRLITGHWIESSSSRIWITN